MSHTHDMVARIENAAERIAPHVEKTALLESRIPGLSGCFLKLENQQFTGSFKLRGAVNRLQTLEHRQRQAGCVTASSGNHGAAVAHAMHSLGMKGIVFVPESTSPQKIDRIREAGAEIRFHGTDGLDTELFAQEYADRRDMTYVSPYNDREVIAGQGTIGVEILAQADTFDRVYVAVGGGGLVSGIGVVLKHHWPEVEIVGCQPAASPVMAESIRAGRILDMPSEPTLSDGTAGGVEPGTVTFELCERYVDRFETVSEEEIADAMRLLAVHDGLRVEGAAGVALAVARRDRLPGRCCVIICGGNVSDEVWSAAVGDAARPGL